MKASRRNGSRTVSRCVLIAFVALANAASAQSNWIFDARAGVLYDSNVSRSNLSRDVLDDAAWKSLIAAGQSFQLTDDLRLGVFGELESHVWATYDGLNSVSPGFAPHLRYRFGLGKNAPWVRVETKLAYFGSSEARRTGWEIPSAIRAGLSVSERLSLEGAYRYRHFDARDVRFDQDSHGVSLRGRFEVTSSTQVALGYTYRSGDVNSHAVPPRPDIVAIAREFGPVDTFDTPYVAYRFSATTHSAAVGINHALNSVAAVQASYEWQRTTHETLQYTNHVAELGIALTF
jgi:hypothetical protein